MSANPRLIAVRLAALGLFNDARAAFTLVDRRPKTDAHLDRAVPLESGR